MSLDYATVRGLATDPVDLDDFSRLQSLFYLLRLLERQADNRSIFEKCATSFALSSKQRQPDFSRSRHR